VTANEALGLAALGSLLIGIFAGFPIAFTLLSLTVLFGYLGLGNRVFDIMVFQAWGLMREETLAAVPLFVFMGYLLEQAGLVERLFRGFQYVLARMKGSLYVGVILTATLFATATGLVSASVTLLGIMAAPVMRRSGYDPALSAGAITAGGTLGILIPPSVMLVVLGPVVGVSIAKLFAGALVPGLLLSALFVIYSLARAFLNPSLGPPLPPEQRPVSLRASLRELVVGVVPLQLLMLVTLGSILAGLATPTEAAGLGAFGALMLTIAYGRFSLRGLRQAIYRTVSTTSMIMLLLATSNMYGAIFNRLGTGPFLARSLLELELPPMGMLLGLMAIIFLLGWPLEWAPIIFIFLPIFLPAIRAANIDLLWFSVLVAVNLQTAFLSPPVAQAAYFLRAVVPEWQLGQIYLGMLQFMILQVIGLLLVLLFPDIALWLPRVLYD